MSIKVICLFPRWYLSKNATDTSYYSDIEVLGERFGIDVVKIKSLKLDLLRNGILIFSYFIYRIPFLRSILHNEWFIRLRSSITLKSSQLNQANVVFSNFLLSKKPLEVPFIFEYDFVEYGATPEIRNKIAKNLKLPDDIIKYTDLIVVRSNESLERLSKLYPEQAHKGRIVPSHYMPYVEPIDIEELKGKWKSIKPIRILFVGRLAKLKGMERLIKAVGDARLSGLEINLTVISNFAGGKISLPKWIWYYKSLSRTRVLEVMRESHIIALPTFQESVAKVLVEGMAQGCALIYPDWYPICNYYKDCGKAVNVLSAESISAGIIELCRNSEKLREIAHNNREIFINKYYHRKIGQKYVQLFEEALYLKSNTKKSA